MRNDLIEAYIGILEGDHGLERDYQIYARGAVEDGEEVMMTFEGWLRPHAIDAIQKETPREHLEKYLEWNGIIGYTSAIYAIATGES